MPKTAARRLACETGHLPDTIEKAIPYYRNLIDAHHEAMLDANVDEVMRLHKQVHNLALRVNGGEPGIIAGDEAPGCVCARKAAAPRARKAPSPAPSRTCHYLLAALFSAGSRLGATVSEPDQLPKLLR